MGDVRVPNNWQLGDLVICFQNKHIGIIVDLCFFGDNGDVATVYWQTGDVDTANCASLYPADG